MNTDQTPIFQFGTSRFLQAHADLFISEALAQNAAAGHISVIQTTGDATRSKRLGALAAPGGYPVHIKGLLNGETVDRIQQVTSIKRTFSTATDWNAISAAFVEQAQFALSNTGDRGYTPSAADAGTNFDQSMSFPAKLQLLLRARFYAGGQPLTVMPMELIVDNGAVLKARVLELAGADTTYRDWLQNELTWVNSLVDRIVSEPLDPAGAVAEPYALWAIEGGPDFNPPCRHDCIKVMPSLETAEALKLFILNLGHTYLAQNWQHAETPPVFVRQYLDADAVRNDLLDLYETEVLPGFAAAGLHDQARAYVTTTMDRFRNPFLDHKFSDIAENHAEKIDRRVRAFLDWKTSKGCKTPTPRLTKLAATT